ncbi:Rieske (2Fe-2S) protein [Cohnella candidum]|uniref:Rieske (2Fe-2S) protein n=1 Tax=Cohnella candidum TaxID=2674991 RepID=A0A3G3JZ64_9BACL|nr:Rieske (2Fe-2S) protein [Cohnella candidum]AYQ73540.1 Rieske (2Fe-2S) protein [Cohnella candidum]
MSDIPPGSIDLGLPEDYAPFPASVTLDGAPYWLVRREEGDYRLFSALCPHAGGDVLVHGNLFFCPLHFWTFDQAEGRCQNVHGERLMERTIEQDADGRLYAVGESF